MGSIGVNVCLVAGKAKYGKDTFASFLKQSLEKKGKKVLILHFADYLKFICKEYMGWDGVKNNEGRTLLQHIGTDVIRNRNNDFWTDVVAQLIAVLYKDYDYFIVPDCRFINEVEVLKFDYSFNVKTFWVVRKENGEFYDNGLTEEQKNHRSENDLNIWPFDHIVFNTSDLDNLKAIAEYYADLLIETER